MSPTHRRPVPLSKAYRLLNHGPTVLVSAAHDGKRNIMAAAWAMPLDFEPPKVAVVLDKATWTRQLLEAAGTFVLQVLNRLTGTIEGNRACVLGISKERALPNRNASRKIISRVT